jgi:hypothetical protein
VELLVHRMWVFLVKTHSTVAASVYTISENAIGRNKPLPRQPRFRECSRGSASSFTSQP